MIENLVEKSTEFTFYFTILKVSCNSIQDHTVILFVCFFSIEQVQLPSDISEEEGEATQTGANGMDFHIR